VLLLQYVAVIIVGYLLGSIPTGYVIGRLKGVNVLEHGSGRIGGTNVLRSVGLWAAALTGAGDVAKGALAVLIGRVLLGTELAATLGGIAAVIGHNWSIYIGFRGGAGTATYMGGFAMLSLMPTVIVGLSSFIIGFALRYASVASILISILMAPALLIAVLFFNEPVEHLAYALVVGGIILFSHRPNIRRLLKGTERRLGEPAKKVGEEEA
jgi:glycerol-3-phosphate acyltransferase PlsY